MNFDQRGVFLSIINNHYCTMDIRGFIQRRFLLGGEGLDKELDMIIQAWPNMDAGHHCLELMIAKLY